MRAVVADAMRAGALGFASSFSANHRGDRGLPVPSRNGTAEEFVRKIERYAAAGVDHLLCYVQFGDLPHQKVMRTLELLSSDVMPRLAESGHQLAATVSV